MSTQTALLPFDSEAFCDEQARNIRLLGQRVVANILEIGKRLIAVRQRIGHGEWLPWLQREFKWGEDTACRYIQVAGTFGKSRTVQDLDVCNIDAFALYTLSAPSISDSLREEAMERAAEDKRITRSVAEQMVEGPKAAKEASTKIIEERAKVKATAEASPVASANETNVPVPPL